MDLLQWEHPEMLTGIGEGYRKKRLLASLTQTPSMDDAVFKDLARGTS